MAGWRSFACLLAVGLVGGAGCTSGSSGSDPAPSGSVTTTADPGTPAPPAPAPSAPTPSESPPASAPGPVFSAPLSRDGWTFFGSGQGLPAQIEDVSADEGGNVYVAGRDAVYAKRRADDRFLRFDSANAGITRNCYEVPPEGDPTFNDAISRRLHPSPPGPAVMCPIISVAGAAPGLAAIGFKGIGTDGDPDADWAQESGGLDLVAFDGTTMSRRRHVLVASPPGTICGPYDGHPLEERVTACGNPFEWFWTEGRRKLRQVNRIAVNHDTGSRMYGDVWMGGTHATLAGVLNDAAARGYPDRTAGKAAKWADAKDVWEHDHPAFYSPRLDLFLTGDTYGVAIEPRSGRPWGSNGFRTGFLTGGYGPTLSGDNWFMHPQDAANPLWIDFFPDPPTDDPLGGANDNVTSLSFCDDGTLWAGSSTHGLVRRDPGGGTSGVAIPDPAKHGNSVNAVACDPSDGSVWIGLGWGGVMRYRGGAFSELDPDAPGMPAVVRQPVRSIQIDRWSSPRVVYVAFVATRDGSGTTVPGGVAAYAGP